MKKYYIIGAIILLVGLLINYKFDGFKKTELIIIKVENYTVSGVAFEGSYKSSALVLLVDSMRAYQKELKGETNVVIINYIDKAKETLGVVSNFVGISGDGIKFEKKFEKRIIKATKAIRVVIKIQPLIMSTPEKIKAKAFELAKEKGLTLQNLSIEQYNKNGTLVIDFPIKNE